MEYLARIPSPPLDSFIKRLWYCSDTSVRPATSAPERVLPGGHVDLVINLADDQIRVYDPANPGTPRSLSGAVVRGTSTRSFLTDPQRSALVGVHFLPGGAFPFFGISPAEIVDDYVHLHELWGTSGRSLREQLLEAGSPSEQLHIVEAVLLRRLRVARPGHPAARAAITAFGAGDNAVSVAEVAALVGLSHRGFIDVFQREVGLTPKVYARLQRFHCAKERIAALGTPPSWATLAIECGYFDQSHMIRDFVGFAGITPTSYLRCRTGETRFDHFVHNHAARSTQVPLQARARTA
jgi:AraC-like DNA-binding protein